MNFYPFHIGDYISHTNHLTNDEDLAYRRMIDLYYMTEQPLNDSSTIARRIRSSVEIVDAILSEFFEFCDDECWHNKRVDEEIVKYHSRLDQASKAGKASAEARLNKRSTSVQPTKNQEPRTSSDATTEKPKKRKTTLKISKDTMPESYEDFCKEERPDLNPLQTYHKFCDHWIGNGVTKADWLATWRNWVRNEKRQFKATTSTDIFDEMMRRAK